LLPGAHAFDRKTSMGNRFTITGNMNCELSLTGRKN